MVGEIVSTETSPNFIRRWDNNLIRLYFLIIISHIFIWYTFCLSQPTTRESANFGSIGGANFQGGNISNSQGQEINSLGSVPSPSSSKNANWNEGGYDDDGFPVGIFVVLLALLAILVYRKSQHRQQRDCSRAGYQRVQVAPDKRDQWKKHWDIFFYIVLKWISSCLADNVNQRCGEHSRY